MPTVVTTDNQINNCFDVMAELRPHLKGGEFLSTIREMEKGGYKLVCIENEGTVAAVAGFRISQSLFMGKHLYVDDLVTASSFRSKGYGEQLIVWLRNHAKNEGCAYLHLDSGTHRGRAHKFYFSQGFTIASYHFSEKLEDS